MKELGLQFQDVGLRRYDPDQPRVPAGSGRESGRWSGGVGGGESATIRIDGRAQTRLAGGGIGSHLPIVNIAADGPFDPRGIRVVPLTEPDPLDPMGLNKPLDPSEQQAIADTVNAIVGGNPKDLPTLNPHPYENRPHQTTGARLPLGTSSYTTYYVRRSGALPGAARLIVDQAAHIFYTNNHYRSFYPVDLTSGGKK